MKQRGIWFLLALMAGSCSPPGRTAIDEVIQTGISQSGPAVVCKDLVNSGDFGVGLLAEGSFIMESSKVYRIAESGRVDVAPVDTSIPFALTTRFEVNRSYDVADMSYAVFKNTLNWKRPAPGRIYALRVDGFFQRLDLQNGGEIQNVRGSLRGFFYPDYLRGINEPGYHLLFMNSDRSLGGPVAGFVIQQARIELDECTSLKLNLPEKLP